MRIEDIYVPQARKERATFNHTRSLNPDPIEDKDHIWPIKRE